MTLRWSQWEHDELDAGLDNELLHKPSGPGLPYSFGNPLTNLLLCVRPHSGVYTTKDTFCTLFGMRTVTYIGIKQLQIQIILKTW